MRIVPTQNLVCLQPGIATVVANNITGNGASSQLFVVPEGNVTVARSVSFTPDTLTAMTTLTVDVEASSDGGTTWTKFQTGLALIATSVPATVVVQNMNAGLLYRLNVPSGFTGTSASVSAVCS